jgi:hypothetical protein
MGWAAYIVENDVSAAFFRFPSFDSVNVVEPQVTSWEWDTVQNCWNDQNFFSEGQVFRTNYGLDKQY